MVDTVEITGSSSSVQVSTTTNEVVINTTSNPSVEVNNVATPSTRYITATSVFSYEYVSSASQAVYSGPDINGNTLKYSLAIPSKTLVFLNGVLLADQDYTADDGSSITLADAAAEEEILQILAYDVVDSGIPQVPSIALPYASLNSYKVITSSTNESVLASFDTTEYVSARYTITASTATDTHITELLVIFDSSDAYATQFGTVFTSTRLGTFTVERSGSSIILKTVPSTTTPTTFVVTETLTVA